MRFNRKLPAVLLITLFVLFFVVAASWAATPEELEEVVNLDVSLAVLDQAVQRGRAAILEDERFFVVEAIVSTIAFVNADPENPEDFVAEIEIVSGEWRSVRQVVAYRAIARVTGPEFAARIPTRPSRNPPPGVIEANSQVLVVGTIREVRGDVAVLDALYIRNLQ